MFPLSYEYELSYCAHLDGVRRAQRVEPEGRLLVIHDELLPHTPHGEEDVSGVGLHPGSEALVEPQVVPPYVVARDKKKKETRFTYKYTYTS